MKKTAVRVLVAALCVGFGVELKAQSVGDVQRAQRMGGFNLGNGGRPVGLMPHLSVPLIAVARAELPVLVPGQTGVLDASRSRFPKGFIGTFQWTQIKGPMVALQGSNQSKATFAAAANAELGFRLTINAGTNSSSDEVTVRVVPLKGVVNGDFSKIDPSGLPTGWQLARADDKAQVVVDAKGGEGGMPALRITTPPISALADKKGEYAPVQLSQSVQLEPYRIYRLRARMRGENVQQSYLNHLSPECVGPSVGVDMWLAESFRNPQLNDKLKGTFGWTDVELDFPTMADGTKTIYIHSGHSAGTASNASGTVWIDNVRVEPVPDRVSMHGRHVVLFFSKMELAHLGSKRVQECVDEIDSYFDCISDLTGRGMNEKLVFFAPWTWGIWAGAWSGNPVLLSGGKEELKPWYGKLRRMPFFGGHIHEISHNLGVPPVVWGEIAPGTLAYYAVGELGLRGGPDQRTGMAAVRWYHREVHRMGEGAWLKERRVSQSRIQDKFMLIAERAGWRRTWDAFKQVFRMVLVAQQPDNPNARLWKADVDYPSSAYTPEFVAAIKGNMWQQFKAVFDAASMLSGFDMWSVFTKEEVQALEARLSHNDLGD